MAASLSLVSSSPLPDIGVAAPLRMTTARALSAVPLLGSTDVHVWGLSLPDWRPRHAGLWHTLSADERARADRFRHDADWGRFVVGRAALRRLAAHDLQCSPSSVEIDGGPAGKPFVVGASLHLNVSHSGDWVLVATTRVAPVGVDVEACRPDVDVMALAPTVFSPWELRTLRAAPAADRRALFYSLWARKEAVIKADGAGVGFVGLHRFDVEFRPGRAASVRRVDGQAAPDWTLRAIDLGSGYAGAVAVRAPSARLTAGRLTSFA